MRSHRRRAPLHHVLLAGGVEDLGDIRRLLMRVGADAYGQVVLELPVGASLPELDLPLRVSLHRVDRDLAAPGAVLTAAVDAWRSEWLPELPAEGREVSVWVGTAVASPDPR